MHSMDMCEPLPSQAWIGLLFLDAFLQAFGAWDVDSQAISWNSRGTFSVSAVCKLGIFRLPHASLAWWWCVPLRCKSSLKWFESVDIDSWCQEGPGFVRAASCFVWISGPSRLQFSIPVCTVLRAYYHRIEDVMWLRRHQMRVSDSSCGRVRYLACMEFLESFSCWWLFFWSFFCCHLYSCMSKAGDQSDSFCIFRSERISDVFFFGLCLLWVSLWSAYKMGTRSSQR